jgi:hypothetical protein
VDLGRATAILARRAPVALAAGLTAATIVLLSGSPASILARQTQRPLTRYSLVHGCYLLRAPGSGSQIGAGHGPFRMQPAALGVYLL